MNLQPNSRVPQHGPGQSRLPEPAFLVVAFRYSGEVSWTALAVGGVGLAAYRLLGFAPRLPEVYI
jgi:hypothetical protein